MRKKTPDGRQSARAPGGARITISLPKCLLARIDQAAAAEDRDHAGFIAEVMRMLLEPRGLGLS